MRSRTLLVPLLLLALVLAGCGGTPAAPTAESSSAPSAAAETVASPAASAATEPSSAAAPSAAAESTAAAVEASAAGASEASGDVTVLLIGKPAEDGIDAVTGKPIPGVAKLKDEFAAVHPEINLNLVNIEWGSGSTGYSPKTEAMVQNDEACVYLMPGAQDFGKRGLLVDLNTLIDADAEFENVWPGDSLQQWSGPGPDGKAGLWGLPYSGGNRVIHWDAKLFKDWGVEPLSEKPTLAEIEEKAAKMTGTNPVTGEENFGYWYQGKYVVWQFMAIAHAMGANWGEVGADGAWQIDWNTPEYEQALDWLVKMSKLAPPGALAADAMPEGFLTDQNTVAIIPEGESGYYILPFIAQPELQERYRTSMNLKGEDGKGGLFIGDPLSMAASCPNKEAAWVVMKWLAGSVESQRYNFESGGNPPVIADAASAAPDIGKLVDAEAILGQATSTDDRYPWAASQPRWSLQTAIEAALAGTMTPKQALEQAQTETADWLAQQASGQ